MEHDDAGNEEAPGSLQRGGGLMLLVGQNGRSFVASALSTHDPAEAIQKVQQSGALRDPDCEPLLGLLDHMGQSRAEVYHAMLGAALGLLRERIPRMSQAVLLKLLEAAFPFIGIEEVREVPLAVLDRLSPVPAAFLKQLAADMDLFRELPSSVQRQVWELDATLFRRHVTPSIHGYAEETATVMRELDMSCRLAPIPGQAGTAAAAPSPSGKLGGITARLLPALPRKSLRGASASIQRLMKLVGTSKRLYASVVNLCRAQYADQGTVALCSLRSQLLMALQDSALHGGLAAGTPYTELCEPDRCLRLANVLDACVKDGYCDHKRLKEIHGIIEDFEKAAATAAAAAQRLVTKIGSRAAAQKAGSEHSDGGESISRTENSALSWLADAGMILRDPPVLHLLLHETVRTLEGVVEREAVPKNDPNLCSLSKLLAYAAGTREMLLEHRHVVTVNRDVVEKFYPLLADVILEAQLRDSDDEAETDTSKADEKLVRLMQTDTVVRKVALTYILQRVTVGDVASAQPLLLAAKEALSDALLLDEGPFAASLARQLAAMSTAKKLVPESSFWTAAVDGLLTRATAISMEVHEEVLRLFLAAANQMSTAYLAQCLQTALHVSRRSRKHQKRRRTVLEFEYEPGGKTARARLLPDAGSAGYSSPGGYGSSGATGGYSSASDGASTLRHAKGATDGVRATYALIASKEAARLNEQVAPKLFEYLKQHAKGE